MPFKKGVVTNPNGRPKGSKNTITTKLFNDLLREMKVVEKEKVVSGGKSILKHFIEQAYSNNTVLCALMKKLVADQQATKIDLGEGIEVIVIGAKEKKEREEPKDEQNNN